MSLRNRAKLLAWVLPYAALAFAFSLLIAVAASRGGALWWGLAGGIVLATVAVAARLLFVRRSTDHSGPELAILQVDLDDPVDDRESHEAAVAYQAAFAEVLRHHLRETSTVDPGQILHWADQAMFLAKRRLTQGWRLDPEGSEDGDPDPMGQSLVDATRAGELRLAYQPIVDLATGDLIAVEALVRWQHPTLGLIPPLEFVPLAEESGAIHELGLWVTNEASRQVVAWRQRLPPGNALQVTVNLSPRQLSSATLAADVLEILARNGLPPDDFVAELTEVDIVEDGTAIGQLEALRASGVRIALDDFGTGYSSLRYLTRLPVDILKLDRCFVGELNGSLEGSAVAEAVIRLAQVLHFDTVAEGIERPDQATELTLHGYRHAQGFLFAKPLSPEDMDQLIDASGDRWPRLGPIAAQGDHRVPAPDWTALGSPT